MLASRNVMLVVVLLCAGGIAASAASLGDPCGDCDDGDACTIDTCVDFSCEHAPIGCDDSNECTDDSCDPGSGCVNLSNDTDEDGACPADNCPLDPNSDQTNSDKDGLGDACDACPLDALNDDDSDGYCADADNCPLDPNSDQTNSDKDGLGDACDACPFDAANDSEADGYCADADNCPLFYNPDQADADKNGVGDACTAIRFNFGPPESTVPEGFLLDDGSAFAPWRGFGWQGLVSTRERGFEKLAQEDDTFAFSRDERRWTAQLRNGEYDLHVTSGDPLYAQGPHRVRANGVTVVDDLNTEALEFIDQTSRVSVRNGRLDVVIGGTSGSSVINWIQATPVAEAPSFMRSINFQSDESEAPAGFEPDYGGYYDEKLGYGWNDSLEGVTQESAAPTVLDTFVRVPFFATWEIAVPEPGYYDVWLLVGDPLSAAGPHRVVVEGTPVVLSETTAAGEFLERHAGAFVGDDFLTLYVGPEEEKRLGPADETDINYVVVASASEDADGDEIPNEKDYCPFASDPDQEDGDEDGYGDACDADRDGDGVENPADVCAGAYDPSQEDGDGDGRGDACDACPSDPFDDADADGACGLSDNCPDIANPKQEDADGDGLGDACAELRVNFGPVGFASVDGFQADEGSPFDPFLGRGWSAWMASRDRRTAAPPELDTFVFSSPVRTWRAELPNGNYTVRASIGDALYPQGPQQVVVQGQSMFTDQDTAANDFQTGEVVVEVRNGRLELEIGHVELGASAASEGPQLSGRLVAPDLITSAVDDGSIDGLDGSSAFTPLAAPSGFTTINWVEAVPLGPPAGLFRSINFQPSSSERPYGTEIDAGEPYDAKRGFGWSAQVQTRDRGGRVPQALDTFAFTAALRTWELDVAPGTYRVFVSVGDVLYVQGPQRLVIEGSPVVDESTSAGAFIETSTVVLVEDGQLTIEVGGGGGHTCINYVTVEAVGAESRVAAPSPSNPRSSRPRELRARTR